MARILMDGFEIGDSTYDWTTIIGGFYGYYGIDAVTTHQSGDYSYRAERTSSHATLLTNGGYAYQALPSSYSKLYVKLNLNYLNPEAQDIGIVALDAGVGYGANLSMFLKLNSDSGDVKLYVNNSLVSTSSGTGVAGAWHLVEIMYDYNTTNIVVKWNYAEIIDYTGAIDNNIDYITLANADSPSISNYYEYYFDDVCVNDDTGTINNSWVGNSAIRLLNPTADVSSDFTPSTGSDNYAMVDDIPPDDDTTYNQSLVSNNIDTFSISSTPSIGTGQEINAVQSLVVARADVDISSLKHILVSSTTTDSGTTETANVSLYELTHKIHDVDPNTSAQWTEANVNAVKVGYEMI